MKLVFASSNSHKINEIKKLLPENIELLGLNDIECFDEIPEIAETIEGNAILKADYITQKYGYNCFADDSGLEINTLGGKPGVYSARYAGEPRDDNKNIDKVLVELENQSDRRANFKTVICLNLNSHQYLFTGIIDGNITQERKGSNGFGYDPIFVPDGYDETFAQMAFEEKNQISHRAKAVMQMIDFFEKKSI